MIIKTLHFIFLFFAILQCSFAMNKSELQNIVNRYLALHKQDEYISAVSVSVHELSDDSTLSAYAGYINHKNQVSINENTLFHMGSITKSFTSVLILKLEENPAYHFSIDDKLSQYFPEYPKWGSVTVRQLMNMTSGLPDYIASQSFIGDLIKDPYRTRSNEELVEFAYNLDKHSEPGTQYFYSNTNYILLGMLIEKMTGRALEHEMKKELFEPLHLHHTWYTREAFNKKISPDLVRSYSNKRIAHEFLPMGTDATDFSMSLYGASGAIISNPADITKWIGKLFTPGKVLSAAQLTKLLDTVSMVDGKSMTEPNPQNPNGFGLGVIYSYFPEINASGYAYEGITFAGRAAYLYVPEQKIIIVAAVNSTVDGDEAHPDHLKSLLFEVYRRAF